jgi:hypothetical protein
LRWCVPNADTIKNTFPVSSWELLFVGQEVFLQDFKISATVADNYNYVPPQAM